MEITFKQRNVPVEFHAKTGSCLFLRSSLVTKEDMEIDVRMRSQRSEPCCVVLDRVSCYYGQPSHSDGCTLNTAKESIESTCSMLIFGISRSQNFILPRSHVSMTARSIPYISAPGIERDQNPNSVFFQ